MSDLIDRIRETLSLAEDKKIPYNEFDKVYDKLATEAQEESAPLLQSGQRNHAANLQLLLEGLKSLKPSKPVEVKPELLPEWQRKKLYSK